MGKEKILFVNPPSGFLLDERVFLPLGIASVAAVARERGHEVGLIDLLSDEDYEKKTVDEVNNGNYNVVGITATSPQFYYAHRILRALKSESPETRVIIGGPHASMFGNLRKILIYRLGLGNVSEGERRARLHEEDPNFSSLEDFDTIAEGEEGSLEVALRSDKKWVNGGVYEVLSELPLPARDLFDVGSYLRDANGTPKFQLAGNGKPSGSMISQRGCPYRCEFCCGRDSDQFHRVILPGGVLRAHSPKRILEELDHMNEFYGLESFMFYDDEFNLHARRTIELCELLKDRNYSLRGFIKSDLLVKHPEVATVMARAGFVDVLTGVESGSDRILKYHLNKGTSPEINYRAAMILLENGIGFKALTMVGHTSETVEDVMATRDWLLKTGREFNERLGPGYYTFDLTVFQPYAGCPIWDKAERNTGEFSGQFKWVYKTRRKGVEIEPEYGGIYFNKVDFRTVHGFYKGVPGEYKAFIRTKDVSPETYVKLRDEIEAEVRDKLGMPQLTKVTPISQLEHSMGQGSSQSS